MTPVRKRTSPTRVANGVPVVSALAFPEARKVGPPG
jgi:hypothetical protein